MSLLKLIPVLLRRLEENDKWLDYQANQIDAFQAFRDKKENLQGQADDLLKEMEALNDAKNSLAKRRVKIKLNNFLCLTIE